MFSGVLRFWPAVVVLMFLGIASALPTGAQAIVEGVIVDSDTSTITDPGATGYGKPNQSRIWFNRYQDRWDALVPKDAGGSEGSDHFIVKDVNGTQEFTDVVVEDRDDARPDTYWDNANKRLLVLSSHGTEPTFTRVVYSESTDTYSVHPTVAHVAVPGLTHESENRPASLFLSQNGRIWASVMKEGALLVQQSTNSGQDWLASPVVLATDVEVGVTDWTQFENFGSTYVGLFTAENGEGGVVVTRYDYWFLQQGTNPQASNWNHDLAAIPGAVGEETSDDHVCAGRDDDENQYFVVKTEGGAPTDPVVKLFKRTADGDWSQYKVVEQGEDPEQTRPALVINNESDEIHIYTTDTGGGEGQRRAASLHHLDELASAPVTPVFADSDLSFDDISAPSHPVDASTGLVVLAHSEADNTVWYSEETIPEAPEPTPCGVVGGTPQVVSRTIPQADGLLSLSARIYRPDPSLQEDPCPLISMVPRLLTDASNVDWAARRLARDGYVVIVTKPALNTYPAFERAVRSGIDFMLSSGNPWPDATDTERIGIVGGPLGSHALTETQETDSRVDAMVAWDNLSTTPIGDRGSPSCQLIGGIPRTPTVPAMGQASDGCMRDADAKKTGFNWWRENDVESMQLVFAGSNYKWWGPEGTSAQHDRVHYYTLAWFDRWLKEDATATERLVSRVVLGTPVTTLLDGQYRSAAFFDGYDCGNFRSSCPAP